MTNPASPTVPPSRTPEVGTVFWMIMMFAVTAGQAPGSGSAAIPLGGIASLPASTVLLSEL